MSTAAITTAKEVFDLLHDDLMAVEQEFERLSSSEVDSITEIAEYLREGGGKRIRPALLLLAAKALGYNRQQQRAPGRRDRDGAHRNAGA